MTEHESHNKMIQTLKKQSTQITRYDHTSKIPLIKEQLKKNEQNDIQYLNSIYLYSGSTTLAIETIELGFK